MENNVLFECDKALECNLAIQVWPDTDSLRIDLFGYNITDDVEVLAPFILKFKDGLYKHIRTVPFTEYTLTDNRVGKGISFTYEPVTLRSI